MMAIVNVPPPQIVPGIGTALGQGLQNFLLSRQQTRQNQAQQELAKRFNINVPANTSPQLVAALISNASQAQAAAQQPFTLGVGQQRRDAQGNVIAAVPPKPLASPQTSSVILDPNDPTKAIRVRNTFDQQGNLVNQQKIGDATLAEAIGGVAEAGLQKPTQTKIEKDIIDLDTTLTELDAIEKRFNENFFTFRGKIGAEVTSFFEKAEIPTGKERQQFLRDKTTFFADSKRVFLKFRKFITGVAGGIQEFREIAKATIDPESDSPTEFTAKLNSMRDNATRTRNVLLAIRNSGLDVNNAAVRKRELQGLSLASVPLQVPPNITIDQLKGGQVGTQPTIPQTGFTPEKQVRLQELLEKSRQ